MLFLFFPSFPSLPMITHARARRFRTQVVAAVMAVSLAGLPLIHRAVSPVAEAASPMVAVKTGPAFASPGATIVYTVTVQNTGNSNVTGARVADPVPAHLTFHPGMSTAGCGLQGTTVWCNPETYVPGQTRTYQLAFVVSPNAPVGHVIDNVADVWSNNAEPTWSNHAYTRVIPGGTASVNVGGHASTAVNNQVNAASQNNTQVWQQQQNNMPFNTWQNVNLNPTAVTTVDNTVNAAATNNTQVRQNPGLWGASTTVSPTAEVEANNQINAASQNNTALWQQQQNNMPWGGGQTANVNPTAVTTVDNTMNAGAFNNQAVWQGWW
jgi:uncharacterized repeat protein (TIGR01451 family)